MRQIHNVKPRTPLAIAVDALAKLQVQTAVLTELAERTRNPDIAALALRMYETLEAAIRQAKGGH